MTELFDAIKARDVNRVRALLDADAALVNARAESGDTALLTAVYYGAPEVADLLLARGADLSFFEAAAVGDADRLRSLLTARPELLAAYSHDGWTALHLAAFFGHAAAAAFLLEQGAPVSAVGRNGNANTPLHAALAGGDGGVARLLLQHGADVNATDGAGWIPLHHAACNGDPELVAGLLARGARAGARTNQGQTPLDLARAKGRTPVVALLENA